MIIRRALPAVAAALAVMAAWGTASVLPPAAQAAGSYRGSWRLNYLSPATIDLELSYRSGHSSWNSGDTLPFDAVAFSGLTMSDIKTAQGDKHFQIVRDAGNFDCTGYFSSGIGSGVFNFIPSSAFAAGLASRGLGRPNDKDQFELALSNVTLSMVDRLKADGVTGLSAKALVTLANHDVNAKYLDGLAANGVRPVSVDGLVRLRDHDVSPDYIAGLAKFGYHPSVDDLVRLRDHDVSVDFVSRLRAHGYHPNIEDLIRLRDTGM